MKILVTLTILLVSASTYAQLGNLTPEDEKAIRKLMAQQEAAWNEGDIDTFMEGYWNSENLVFVGGSGTSYGWEATRQGYHKRYPDRKTMGILSFTIIQMDRLGDNHARVLGRFHLSRSVGDASGTFTLLFYRFQTGWKIISDHTSSE